MIQFLPLSLETPAQNLALDEALLESAEAGEIGSVLRFWESPSHFVTLGYTNRASTEANVEECARQNVPILRRASGGGTVLQGPGSWNYALIDRIDEGRALDVESTNRRVMETNRAIFEELLGERVEIAGHTDLITVDETRLKFSGNAQRRKQRFFLFHGTALLDFDLDLVQTLLRAPSKEPEYRANRSHRSFIRNLPLGREALELAFRRAWKAETALENVPMERVEKLVREKYALDAWNLRF